ncbi:glucose-6-phosphate dehydrogenase [Rathayibacter tanaceti]|uniref:Glucose-6-phosphate 1-dehydrogenase n=2 Tax=Rathayibacter tanaceti TaxID=1671680 RepID=A0A162GHG8_9MICO|nr:glucose-6-phosphate dehydrogenase [Rathayibacter tanaceti]KZX21229.1 Glucose-6-phosphate 1-dehydrogenase [Rathayibacter tanaceti]QHC56816.1 glucose-6-phosphate dehydrogenase [Rathayibacter tanaceti]TCO37830.1 glucose-6-phosphate 1-dehydrogenase [Rathayibacter tanaceti]
MTEQIGIPEATALGSEQRSIAILGAGGDLTERLLLPGLGRVAELARDLELTMIGAARTPQSDEEWQGLVRRSLEEAGVAAHTVEALASRARFVATDASDPEQLKALLDACPSTPVLYVALPPAMGHVVAASLAELDLPEELVVAIEKPFGEDLDDAIALNAAFARVLPERRLWRIDHFLGNATVLGMLGLRFGNRLLEASWSAEQIEKVEIVYDETLGIEGRAAFYEKTGALRDMLQSHLLMVLALTAMERPDEVTPEEVHARMAEVLGTVRLWRDDPSSARRARYTEGRVDGRFLPSYADEPDVDSETGTETLAQLLLQVDTPRWAGVPFVLRSGKGIGDPRQEVAIHFRAATPPRGLRGAEAGTVLRIGLTAGDVQLDVVVNSADELTDLERTTLAAEPGAATLDPYAQVLAGLLQGDTLLSVPGDVAEQCWRIVSPVLAHWAGGDAPLDEYEAGTAGPEGW